MSRDLAWRDEASSRLAANEVARLGDLQSVLIVGDPRNEVALAAEQVGAEVARWDRMARLEREAQAWPPDGPFDLVAIRLPKSKPALDLIFHAVLPRLAPEGRLLIYGARDEGIRSATRRIEARTGPWITRATGGHTRLLEWVRPAAFGSDSAIPQSIDELCATIQIDLGDGPRAWTTWPGVFGAEGIDAGTALLLENLPEGVGPVLDFAAGSGVLAAGMVVAGTPASDLILTEPDALAAMAARLNVPGARVEVTPGWPDLGTVGTVLSNPPYHEGKAESLSVIEELIAGAANDLRPRGELRMVVQRRLPVEALLQAHFKGVRTIADRETFRVWSGVRG